MVSGRETKLPSCRPWATSALLAPPRRRLRQREGSGVSLSLLFRDPPTSPFFLLITRGRSGSGIDRRIIGFFWPVFLFCSHFSDVKSGQARATFQSADGAAPVRHLRGVSRRRAFEARIRTARDGSSPSLTWIFAVLPSQPPHSPTTPPEEPVRNFAHRRPRVSFGLLVRRRGVHRHRECVRRARKIGPALPSGFSSP